ncbi:MAG: hypothetical protein P0Y62_14355 [Candidatus Chryseobacterium colombiense]|nr:hypothetical protein [Chryseobacterium sp.]WEK69023.1 MAG: hypothetical protein P0Y62_14355 [Chryseobacterium sp.]
MEDKIISDAIHAAISRKRLSQIYTHRDMYKNINYRDISDINIDGVLKSKKIFEWIIEHPNYDYKGLLESHYSNEELFRFFKIYYEDIIYTLNRFFKEDYIIKYSDFE